MMPTKRYQFLSYIVVAFVVSLLISNIVAVKLISFGPIITDGGAILFPVTYILGDILTEIYGFEQAKKTIWMAFVCMIFAVLAITVVRWAPAAPEWHNQEAFVKVLGFVPRIVVASLLAFLVGQFVNSVILAKLKIITRGKLLWLRLIGSTVAGELLDTVIFTLVAFTGVLQGWSMLRFILIGWIFKTLAEVAVLPLSYKIIKLLKIKEGIDKYDYQTNFSPFRLNRS
ncbi:queuosine precursor transporter [Candidatus Saccharibacteria bacterium]|nr:queuosine precursor transporter [Candidatus Saccharibacteria bacterium]HOR23235.1 queuosine precursor transporter [Candidatus Saccharibacteria bacterium]